MSIQQYPIEILLECYWKNKMFLELNAENPWTKNYIAADKLCDEIFLEIYRRLDKIEA